MAERPLVLDFETDGILPRPDYPPEPRGIAIDDGRSKTYVRNFDKLKRVWNTRPMLFHNAPFDIAVAVEKLGLPIPKWEHIHDTQVLAYLADPYASTRLKDQAAKHLDMPPDEQTDVRDWIMANVPEAKRKKVNWGFWIARAPMPLLKPYAIGDVVRTYGLWQHYQPVLQEMRGAYDREMKLVPILLRNSRQGVRVDVLPLKRDTAIYEKVLLTTDARICKLLGRTFNVGSSDELADALEASGQGEGFLITKTGKRSTSKKSLAQCELNPAVAELLDYRGRLETALTTFMRNWCETVERTVDRVHFDWSSTRSEKGGARTGRLSSSPNCQNIPKEMKAKAPKGLPPLPHLREYLLPDEGCVWVRKDYQQQELRVLAHFEDGDMLQMYLDQPDVDVHQMVANIMGVDRTPAKTLGFALLYGMGLAELSARLGVSVEKARQLKAAYLRVLPGLKALQKEIEANGRAGIHITTWGGRKYLAEPPKIIKGRLQSFEYKLLNYLIQGSSADCTKEAMCRTDAANLDARLLVSVHDELDFSVPNDKRLKNTVRKIDAIMRSIEFDVPMLSDTEVGESWGSLQKYQLR